MQTSNPLIPFDEGNSKSRGDTLMDRYQLELLVKLLEEFRESHNSLAKFPKINILGDTINTIKEEAHCIPETYITESFLLQQINEIIRLTTLGIGQIHDIQHEVAHGTRSKYYKILHELLNIQQILEE